MKINKGTWVFSAFALLIMLLGIFLLKESAITGFIIYEQTTVFEAEDLTVVYSYIDSTSCACPDPSDGCVRNAGYEGQTGSVKYIFGLEPGLYDIAMRHCPENDGNDVYKLYLNGNLIRTFYETSDSQVWEEYIFEGINLNQGDEIKISCTKSSSNTYCRIDQVAFKKIRQTVKINETIEDAEQAPINSTIIWKQEGEIIQEYSGETHNYQLQSGNYELEITPRHKSIRKIRLNKIVSSDISNIVDVDEDPKPDTEYSQIYAIDPKDPEIEDAEVTITATGTELYKCPEWDFENRECDGEWFKLMDTVPGQEYAFAVDCGYKEKGGCSCKGIRFVDLFSDYSFIPGNYYTVMAKVYSGNTLIDSETVSFDALPQTSIDNDPGHWWRGNLIIEKINQSGILIKFHNTSKGRLLADSKFKIIIYKCNGDDDDDDECDDDDNGYSTTVLGPETIHLSCSQPIGIGDIFGDFEVRDIDKILSGSNCSLGNISLLSPADNSSFNTSNITLSYSVFDHNQSIDYCSLIINSSVYDASYSITEILPQYFNQNLSNGSYEWQVNCTTSNGYIISSAKWKFFISPGDHPPKTALNYPPDSFVAYTSSTYSIVFNCSAEDKHGKNKGIKNISLYITNNQNISFGLNETIIFSGTNTEETALFNKSLAPGNYTWNCLAYDKGGNYDWADQNRSLKILPYLINDTTPPEVDLISPPNNSVDYDGYITFLYNVTDNESGIQYCELIIGNNVVDTDYSITKNITQSFIKFLPNGKHNWSVNCTNDFNLTGSSKKWAIAINITIIEENETACCCGLRVSTTPEVVSQDEKVLVAADVSNLFTGLAAAPADLLSINVTIYRVDNGTETIIISNASMTYLANGLWYYEFYTGNNSMGTYIASVAMVTNQTTPFVKEASDAFTIGEKVSGLTITGVSPDLIGINKTARLAAEIKYNGIAVDQSLILNASLFVQMINGSNQTFSYTSLQVEDGIIYADGIFNETGIYYLDWAATYLGQTRTAREIVVVVGWEDLLEDINYTVNVELIGLIKETRQYLLELLTDMEHLQEFTEEEIFLITDSVNSMSKVVNYLENGEITNEEAEKQYNQIKSELESRLGIRLTGAAIGDLKSIEGTRSPIQKAIDSLKDWRMILFIVLLFMFSLLMAILLLLIRLLQGGISSRPMQQSTLSKYIENPIEKHDGSQAAQKPRQEQQKRRYELLVSRLRKKMKEKLQKKQETPKKEIKPVIKEEKEELKAQKVQKNAPKKPRQEQQKRRYELLVSRLRKRLEQRKQRKKENEKEREIILDRKFYKY